MYVAYMLILLLAWTSPATAQDTRQFYLSPVDGTGTDLNPFRARCLGLPGKGNIDLRLNRAIATGYSLCASNNLPSNMTGVIVLGAGLNATVPTIIRNIVQTVLSVTLSTGTVEELIKEVIIPRLSRPPSGRYKIYLGNPTPTIELVASLSNDIHYKGLVVALAERERELVEHTDSLLASAWDTLQPVVAWATTLSTETFTASDGNLDGCACVHSWTEYNGTAMTIASNQVAASGSTTVEARNNSTLASVNHNAGVTVVNVATGGAGTLTSCGAIFRKENNATRTNYMYQAAIRTAGELNMTELAQREAGTKTILDDNYTDWVANDVLLASVDSSHNIVAKVNGSTRITYTDATPITAGTYTGIMYFSDSASGTCTLDNQTAEDLSSTRRGTPLWFN